MNTFVRIPERLNNIDNVPTSITKGPHANSPNVIESYIFIATPHTCIVIGGLWQFNGDWEEED